MKVLMILTTFTMISCAGFKFELPPKPPLEACILTIKDTLENSYAVCQDDETLQSFVDNRHYHSVEVIALMKKVTSEDGYVKVPLKLMNNWIAQSPTAFGRLLTYLKQLEKRLKEEYENAVQMVQDTI